MLVVVSSVVDVVSVVVVVKSGVEEVDVVSSVVVVLGSAVVIVVFEVSRVVLSVVEVVSREVVGESVVSVVVVGSLVVVVEVVTVGFGVLVSFKVGLAEEKVVCTGGFVVVLLFCLNLLNIDLHPPLVVLVVVVVEVVSVVALVLTGHSVPFSTHSKSSMYSLKLALFFGATPVSLAESLSHSASILSKLHASRVR